MEIFIIYKRMCSNLSDIVLNQVFFGNYKEFLKMYFRYFAYCQKLKQMSSIFPEEWHIRKNVKFYIKFFLQLSKDLLRKCIIKIINIVL